MNAAAFQLMSNAVIGKRFIFARASESEALETAKNINYFPLKSGKVSRVAFTFFAKSFLKMIPRHAFRVKTVLL